MPVAFLLDHFVCPRQHVGRDRETDLLRCLKIDHKLELRRLLVDSPLLDIGSYWELH